MSVGPLMGGLLAAATVLAPSAARAWGAVAEANGTNASYIGAIVNQDTSEGARERALATCRDSTQPPLRSRCRIVSTFEDKCFAVASDDPSSPTSEVYGWAVAATRGEAEAEALRACRAKASGGQRCLPERSICDARAPAPAPAPVAEAKPQPASSSGDAIMVIVAVAVLGAVGLGLWHAATAASPPAAPPAPVGSEQVYAGGAEAHRRGSLLIPLARPSAGVPGAAPQQGPFGRHALVPQRGGPAFGLDAHRLAHAGLTLGRAPDNDIVLQDSRVSSRHARLYLDREGTLRIEDLKSTNGTWRNGQRVMPASLRRGDVLQVGDSTFNVES